MNREYCKWCPRSAVCASGGLTPISDDLRAAGVRPQYKVSKGLTSTKVTCFCVINNGYYDRYSYFTFEVPHDTRSNETV